MFLGEHFRGRFHEMLEEKLYLTVLHNRNVCFRFNTHFLVCILRIMLFLKKQHKPICAAQESLTPLQQNWKKAGEQAARRMLATAFSEITWKISCVCPWKENINYHIRLAIIHHTVTVHCAEFLTASSINKLHSGPLVVFKFMLSVAIYCCPLG